MLNEVLRARYYWERGDSEPALRLLNKVLAGCETIRAFYWTKAEVKHELRLPFEIAVMNLLLTKDVLLLPFEIAFARLWNAFPLQYLILLLFQRLADHECDATIINLLSQAAAIGLISNCVEDYDVSGKVVLDPYAYPDTVEFLGGDSFLAIVEQAMLEDAWSRWIAPDAVRVINLFMYAVFHRERPVRGEMILIRLDRIADSQSSFLYAFSRHLDGLLDDEVLSASLVSVGMRIEQAPNALKCLREFADAIACLQFEPFVRRYFRFDD